MHVSSNGKARSPVGADDKVDGCLRADSATKLRHFPTNRNGSSALYVVVEDGWMSEWMDEDDIQLFN